MIVAENDGTGLYMLAIAIWIACKANHKNPVQLIADVLREIF